MVLGLRLPVVSAFALLLEAAAAAGLETDCPLLCCWCMGLSMDPPDVPFAMLVAVVVELPVLLFMFEVVCLTKGSDCMPLRCSTVLPEVTPLWPFVIPFVLATEVFIVSKSMMMPLFWYWPAIPLVELVG